MDAFYISTVLVKPAAGRIYQSGRIQPPDHIPDFLRGKLSPAFIKGNPAYNGRMVVKCLDSLSGFLDKLLSAFIAFSGKKKAAVILYRNTKIIHKSCQVCNKPGLIGAAAIYHILPYQHTHTVTMEVPAVGFDFSMLAKHVKAQLLHSLDIVDQSLVRGSCVQPVRPVSLVQHSCLENGMIIQTETGDAFFILLNIQLAHGKISIDLILAKADPYRIKKRRIRSPGDRILYRDAGCFAGNNRDFKEKLLTYFFGDSLLCKKTGRINLAQGFLSAVRASDLYFKGKALMIQIGSQFQAFNMVCSNFFQPYCLPDPALGSVEHAAWSQFLFSAAVIGCVTEIPH